MYVIHEWSYVRFRDTHPVPFARGALYYRAGRRVEHHAMARSRVPVTAVPAPVLARGTGTGTGTDVITAHNWLVLHSTCVAAGDPADLNADASPLTHQAARRVSTHRQDTTQTTMITTARAPTLRN